MSRAAKAAGGRGRRRREARTACGRRYVDVGDGRWRCFGPGQKGWRRGGDKVRVTGRQGTWRSVPPGQRGRVHKRSRRRRPHVKIGPRPGPPHTKPACVASDRLLHSSCRGRWLQAGRRRRREAEAGACWGEAPRDARVAGRASSSGRMRRAHARAGLVAAAWGEGPGWRRLPLQGSPCLGRIYTQGPPRVPCVYIQVLLNGSHRVPRREEVGAVRKRVEFHHVEQYRVGTVLHFTRDGMGARKWGPL